MTFALCNGNKQEKVLSLNKEINMNSIIDHRVEPSLNDFQKYKKWGNLLARQSWVHLFTPNASVNTSAIQNGLECFKAKTKLNVLQDNNHSDNEKDKRLSQINMFMYCLEEAMKHDLEYRGLLTP